MSVRPRVLMVGAFPPPGRRIYGGMVTSCAALMRSTLPSRIDIVPIDSTQISNPAPSLAIRLLIAVPRLWRFVMCLERMRPDTVVLFVALGASVIEKGAMAWYARVRGVPAVLFPRGGGLIDACESSRFTLMWVRVAFRGARRVFCQSEHWQRFAQERLGFQAADSPVIPNWTASEDLLQVGRNRLVRLSRAEGGGQPIRLMFVGWLDFEKGIRELIEASERLAPRLQFSLSLIGEGNSQDWVKERVRDSVLAGRVTLHGWMSSEELLQAYAQSDVFVLPSWAEGLPNAMIEAMAAGLAVVVSSVGSVPAFVNDGQEGMLVPAQDTAALATVLEQVITDAGLRRQLGTAAFRQAESTFRAETAVELMVHQFQALTMETRAGAGKVN